MSNLIILAILIAAAILLTWLGLRAWRAKRPFVRWAGAATASVLVVVLCLISGIAVAGLYKMQLRTAPVPDLKVEATSEQIRRGEAITESFCGACHSRASFRSASRAITASPEGPTMCNTANISCPTATAANVTALTCTAAFPANCPDLNVVKDWTRAGFIATMRTGKDPYGHELSQQMPRRPIGTMSDDELSAIYEYLTRMVA
jgi:hypothetical protein